MYEGMTYVRRFPRPRLVRLADRPFPFGFRIALSEAVAPFAGPFPTVMAYAIWTPFGIRRRWAF